MEVYNSYFKRCFSNVRNSINFCLKNRLDLLQKDYKMRLALVNNLINCLSTVQIGITLISILTGIYSDKITTNVQKFYWSFTVLKPYSVNIAVALVVLILTFFAI
jgi:putative hemolysin